MARRKTSFGTLKLLALTINGALVLGLGCFAKDNIVATWERGLSPDVTRTQTLASAGTITVAFSPKGGATNAISAAIAEARLTILVSAYSFTSAILAKDLLQAKKRGVQVSIILDKSQMSQRYSSAHFFINQGFNIKIDTKHAIAHNKVMIIDDKTVVTGSFNFTKAAESKNAENVIILRNNTQLAQQYKENWQLHWKHSTNSDVFPKLKN